MRIAISSPSTKNPAVQAEKESEMMWSTPDLSIKSFSFAACALDEKRRPTTIQVVYDEDDGPGILMGIFRPRRKTLFCETITIEEATKLRKLLDKAISEFKTGDTK